MNYAKAAVAVLAAGASAALAALTGDQTISTLEWVNILIAIATAASVFTAPNVPGASVTKAALAAIMTGLTACANLVGANSSTSWWQLFSAFLGAALVYAVRNTPHRGLTAA
ncbi:hypothetical protein [Amycolatopsis dendrobii]|uniref:SPW repeat-containing protein n=1 Tax=Amycolatopsis dendrobii TaxID=2760662 RepID=A0A7W3VUN0_9PSEU|nr:hypothetical protein [Amycolatopsis dendrobii]MBB1153534.1 hypothetical protein [Amycolatopsis dendrobii]